MAPHGVTVVCLPPLAASKIPIGIFVGQKCLSELLLFCLGLWFESELWGIRDFLFFGFWVWFFLPLFNKLPTPFLPIFCLHFCKVHFIVLQDSYLTILMNMIGQNTGRNSCRCFSRRGSQSLCLHLFTPETGGIRHSVRYTRTYFTHWHRVCNNISLHDAVRF